MMHASLDLLEFDALKALLGRYVSTPMGQAAVAAVAPGTDCEILAASLAETGEAMEYLRTAARPQTVGRGGAVRLHFDVADPSAGIRKLQIEGAVLEPLEILDLTEFLDRAAEARALLAAAVERFPRLGARAAGIGEFRPLLKELSGKVLPDGTIADYASVALGRIRRDMERQRKQIQDSLERFLKLHREDGVLQEDFVTIRNERFVVPVVPGARRRVEGVIHGASGTGHTLFLEPFETIDLNNELVAMAEEEMREVHRILREMTGHLRRYAESIARALGVMSGLEFLFAKAQFAIDFECVIPGFSPAGRRRLHLLEARHPLLDDVLRGEGRRPVPVSLKLDEDQRTLLISGPNTGGKTVTMKTVGLLSLMAQSALPVPCVEAEFPIFQEILADIGDQQSIQESLSTFSAHITRVRDMMQQATRDSLILLDELGRATDPEEGGPLGVAILDRFLGCGSFTVASTHLLALKIFGTSTPGVVNGSMGFDDQTLEPTFRLSLGAPGRSAGLDIAQRLGLPRAVIERARAAGSSSERDIARFLAELQARVANVRELEQEVAERRAALAAHEQNLASEWQQKETAKLRELELRVEGLMARFEQQAAQTIEAIARRTGERKMAEQARRAVARTKRELRQEMEATVLETRDDARQGELGAPKAAIVEGARVRLRDVREPATVLRLLDNGEIEVQAGFMKMRLGTDEVVEVVGETGGGRKLPKNISYQSGPAWNVSYREVNVIGKRAEEAVAEVDKFLDSAALAGVQRVRIIHGHGMGILKRAVSELLASSPHVAKHYPAPPGEGGSGATIAEMREP